MNPRNIVTVVLLVFVLVSVIFLVLQETDSNVAEHSEPAGASKTGGAGPSGNASGSNKEENGIILHKVVVYYFHGIMRCKTCKSIEAYTKEAIDTFFPSELGDGTVEWRVVNVDEPRNEHFVEDFLLTTRAVVLEDLHGGKQKQWKNLERVWELVKDREAFLKYIRNETQEYLGSAER